MRLPALILLLLSACDPPGDPEEPTTDDLSVRSGRDMGASDLSRGSADEAFALSFQAVAAFGGNGFYEQYAGRSMSVVLRSRGAKEALASETQSIGERDLFFNFSEVLAKGSSYDLDYYVRRVGNLCDRFDRKIDSVSGDMAVVQAGVPLSKTKTECP